MNGDFFGNYRALVSMTSVGGEIAALSGPVVNPYPLAKLGVIEEGAYADMLLVDGNPLEDLNLLQEQGRHIPLIMKGGALHKNLLN